MIAMPTPPYDNEVRSLGTASRMLAIEQSLERIEGKLNALIAALAEDEAEEPSRTLDGDLFGGERDQSQSLG